mmetsp:Transcript_3431/g.5195  ORF Transcript_3431/g.5195 Transcript_3431/m.5195 type:complete len:201 (+) Transcript_3431:346-948(+)
MSIGEGLKALEALLKKLANALTDGSSTFGTSSDLGNELFSSLATTLGGAKSISSVFFFLGGTSSLRTSSSSFLSAFIFSSSSSSSSKGTISCFFFPSSNALSADESSCRLFKGTTRSGSGTLSKSTRETFPPLALKKAAASSLVGGRGVSLKRRSISVPSSSSSSSGGGLSLAESEWRRSRTSTARVTASSDTAVGSLRR